jgi:hypothetical protein
MICLRCGYCCHKLMVTIVDDPTKVIDENNLITYWGDSRCKHLRGEHPGKYSCVIHNYEWYKKTPCYDYGQIEEHPDTECRNGKYLINSLNDKKGKI